MTMHYGKIDGNTRERRIYTALARGVEMSTRQLVDATGVCNPATYISGIRRQLPPGEEIVRRRVGHVHYYRLVRHRRKGHGK